MKLWINFNFQETSGGGNQFLPTKSFHENKINSIDNRCNYINNHHNLKLFSISYLKKK